MDEQEQQEGEGTHFDKSDGELLIWGKKSESVKLTSPMKWCFCCGNVQLQQTGFFSALGCSLKAHKVWKDQKQKLKELKLVFNPNWSKF